MFYYTYIGAADFHLFFIKKDKFLEVGGFDETMSGPEDWDLDRKLRQIGKTALILNPIYHNEAEFDLKKYLNKKGYYAKSFDAYIKNGPSQMVCNLTR